MNMLHYVTLFITSLFVALIAVPILKQWANSGGVVDRPDERKQHQQAVPRIGGIAIFLAFLLILLINVELTPPLRGILAGGTVIFLLGLIDDLIGLDSRQKFGGQIVAALLVVTIGQVRIEQLGNLFGWGVIDLPSWLVIPFTIFAMVGVTNAINMIDGLDGLAGGVALIALTVFFVLAWGDHNPTAMTLCACLIGGVLGFLKYNSYPARIFMGDCGSLLLGFLLSCIAILLTQGAGRGISPLVPLLVLSLPIVDTLVVMGRRLLQSKSAFAPDRTHVHHHFLTLGLQHRFTVLVIYGLSFVLGVGALLGRKVAEPLLLAGYTLAYVLIYGALRYLVRHPQRCRCLRFDSARNFLDSTTFARISQRLELLGNITTLLVGVYLLLAWTLALSWPRDVRLLLPVSALLAGMLWLLWKKRQRELALPLVVAYVALQLISLLVERSGQTGLVQLPGRALTQDELVNGAILFLTAGMLLRTIFMRERERLFNGVDFLLFGATIILMPVVKALDASGWTPGAVLKGALLFIGIKLATIFTPRAVNLLFAGVVLVLATVVVRGLAGI